MFTLKGKKVAMRSIPLTSKYTKEKSSKLVFMYNRGELRFWDQIFPQVEFAKDSPVHSLIDRNSRMNSFEERGTDV